MRMLFLLYFCSFLSFATSPMCFKDEAKDYENNRKFAHLFDIELVEEDDSLGVWVLAPESIEKDDFNRASLSLDSLDDPTFFMELKMRHNKDKHVGLFIVKRELIRTYYIQFHYGIGCGKMITVPVIFD